MSLAPKDSVSTFGLYKEGAKRGAIDPCFPSKLGIPHVHNLAPGKHGEESDSGGSNGAESEDHPADGGRSFSEGCRRGAWLQCQDRARVAGAVDKLRIQGHREGAPRAWAEGLGSTECESGIDPEDGGGYTGGSDPLEHSADGQGHGHRRDARAQDLEAAWSEAASHRDVQAEQRSIVRGEASRCGGALSESPRARHRPVGG